MELTGPTLVPIVLVSAESINNQTGIASILKCAEERRFAVRLFGTEGEVSFELQVRAQDFDEGRRILTDAW